jgi:hypothetical protein
MFFESIEARSPELSIRGEPVVELSQRLGPDAIEAALRVGAGVHQARLPEDAQMLRNGRLGEVEMIDQVPDRPFSVAQQTDNRKSLGVTQDLERCQS